MPVPIFRRQPDPLAAQAAAAWFDGDIGRGLLAAEAQLLVPLLERYGGANVLHLLPCDSAPRLPQGAKTRQLTHLFRDKEVWHGDLRSAAGNLPLRGDSMDAILAWHVLADAPERELLAAELLRVLAPEGTLMVVELDPWSLRRSIWARHGPVAWPATAAIAHLQGIGFDLLARDGLGARWSRGKVQATQSRFTDLPLPARASYALSFRKREAAGAVVGLAMA
ncbi:MAG: methyltransferase domain-containing protein [Lysobacteraceae bacterium]